MVARWYPNDLAAVAGLKREPGGGESQPERRGVDEIVPGGCHQAC